MEDASSLCKKRQNGELIRFPVPLPGIVANLLIFEGKSCVISDKNRGKGAELIVSSEVVSTILLPKKQEKLIA